MNSELKQKREKKELRLSPELFASNILDDTKDYLCIYDGAQDLFESITDYINRGYKVVVSFKRVSLITPTFLNTAIGQLYRVFSEEKIKGNLSIADMTPQDLVLLKRVVDNAKEFFKQFSNLKEEANG